MVKQFTIYGERCSGTNYLEGLITKNFNATITWKYGWKHFFGHNDLSNTNDTLFIGIVRNPCDWLNSLFKSPHHLSNSIKPQEIPPKFNTNYAAQQIVHNRNAYNFLNNQFWSLHDNTNKELMEDRNMYTKHRYNNIFEMRYTKLKFLIEDMPKQTNHYILIKYEDLINNFEQTMNHIKEAGNLEVKSNIHYPLNVDTYKAIASAGKFSKTYKDITEHPPLPKHKILNNKLFFQTYEKQLGYNQTA